MNRQDKHMQQALRDSETLPAPTEQALARARQQALWQHRVTQHANPSPARRPWLLWYGSLVAGVCASLLLWLLWPSVIPPEAATPAPEVALLADDTFLLEELEFYENLEFYHWLAIADDAAG